MSGLLFITAYLMPAVSPVCAGHKAGGASLDNGRHGIFMAAGIKVTYMRLDKFLKVSRLIKRRSVANEACDAGRVSVNGVTAKASVKVKVGDVIEISFGTRTVKARVLMIRDTVKKEEAADMVEIL